MGNILARRLDDRFGDQAHGRGKKALPAHIVRLAEKARQKQGRYETEVICGDEFDLHKTLILCVKNPGHKKFIRVGDFTIDHLPEGYNRNVTLFKAIQVLADLTVRITVDFTSRKRPKKFGSGEAFPFHQLKDVSGVSRVGSGWIDGVRRCKPSGEELCGCEECRTSGCPQKLVGRAWVMTAAHVSFNEAEGHHTTCHLFYDSPTADVQDCLALKGAAEVGGFVDTDWSLLRYDMHDRELFEKILAMYHKYLQLRKKVCDTYTAGNLRSEGEVLGSAQRQPQQFNPAHPLTIIVSHPHGGSKMISIGMVTERQLVQGGDDWTQYTYTAATCSGSSGAPVLLVGRAGRWWCDHSHRRRCELSDAEQLNQSGVVRDY